MSTENRGAGRHRGLEWHRPSFMLGLTALLGCGAPAPCPVAEDCQPYLGDCLDRCGDEEALLACCRGLEAQENGRLSEAQGFCMAAALGLQFGLEGYSSAELEQGSVIHLEVYSLEQDGCVDTEASVADIGGKMVQFDAEEGTVLGWATWSALAVCE